MNKKEELKQLLIEVLLNKIFYQIKGDQEIVKYLRRVENNLKKKINE